MSLSTAEKKRLRQIGHHLNPLVQLGGNGLTEAVLAEIDARLEDHELIKVRVGGEDRAARTEIITEIAVSDCSKHWQAGFALSTIEAPRPKTLELATRVNLRAHKLAFKL